MIDANRYADKRPTLRVEGGILRPRTESLRIGGRDGTKLVQGVQSQVERVALSLGDAVSPVHGVLCFLDADWPLIGGSFTVDGIQVLWPRLLIKRMTETLLLDVDVESVHNWLANAFPAA